MRTLLISAFAVTMFFAAFTVYYALRSDTLDGEPFVLITIDPPETELAKPVGTQPTPQPSVAKVQPAAAVSETDRQNQAVIVDAEPSSAPSPEALETLPADAPAVARLPIGVGIGDISGIGIDGTLIPVPQPASGN